MHLHEADLLALLDERVDRLVERVAARAHGDRHVLGVRGADVVVELVRAAGELCEAVHVLLDDFRRLDVVLLAALAALEVHVGVLGRAAHRGMLGVERAAAEVLDVLLVDHRADRLHRNLVDLLDLVRGAEAVEEVEEGNLALERGGVGHHCHVVRLLHGVGAEHREARLAARHHVALVAEDAEALARKGAGRNMEHGGGELAGDLVHVGDHQQQTLRRREGRRERARCERTVDGAGGAAFALHLDDGGDRTPDVRLRMGGELVARLGHRR